MTENMKKFMEALSAHPELNEKLENAGKDEVFAIAKELGIELTDTDFEQQQGELSDDELDAVAGGGKGDCFCPVVGGGSKGNRNDKACACIYGGAGKEKDGDVRCVCVLAGSGGTPFV